MDERVHVSNALVSGRRCWLPAHMLLVKRTIARVLHVRLFVSCFPRRLVFLVACLTVLVGVRRVLVRRHALVSVVPVHAVPGIAVRIVRAARTSAGRDAASGTHWCWAGRGLRYHPLVLDGMRPQVPIGTSRDRAVGEPYGTNQTNKKVSMYLARLVVSAVGVAAFTTAGASASATAAVAAFAMPDQSSRQMG